MTRSSRRIFRSILGLVVAPALFFIGGCEPSSPPAESPSLPDPETSSQVADESGVRILHVNQAHPNASDVGDGGVDRPFRSISAAAAVAEAGDTVYVHPGVYREHVSPARGGEKDAPITYEAAPGHQVFVRGSEIWKPEWTPVDLHPNVFSAALDSSLFDAAVRNPYVTSIEIASPRDTFPLPSRPASEFGDITKKWLEGKEAVRLPRSLGQLFVDGLPLTEAESLSEVYRVPGTWIVNESGNGLVVHFRSSRTLLEERVIELTVRDRIFAPERRGFRHIVVRGFVFEHAANQGPFPQLGAVSVRSGTSWLIEDNIVRHAKTVGIDAGSETFAPENLEVTKDEDKRMIIGTDNVLRNNLVSDNGLCGIAAWHCKGLVLSGNVVERNNWLGFHPKMDHSNRWEEQGAIKIHNATDALLEGNLVRDNDAHGIWVDNNFTGCRVTRNVVINNMGGGIVFEMGEGPALIDHNIVALTRPFKFYYKGDGIYGHDASGVTIAHNLSYANHRYGVFFRRMTNREIGSGPAVVEASNLRVLNNLLINNGLAAIDLPYEGELMSNNYSNYNLVSDGAKFVLNQGVASPITGALVRRLRILLERGEPDMRSRGSYEDWTLEDGLSLKDWRTVTGWDEESIEEDPERLLFRPLSLEVEIQLGEAALQTTFPPVVMPREFPGAPLPTGDKVLAGPWQTLDERNQRFFIWP